MSLNDLAQKLRTQAREGGKVTLDAATLTENTRLSLPSGYDTLVRAAFGLSSQENWVLTVKPEQIPNPANDELHITAGTSTFKPLGVTDAGVDLRLHVQSNTTNLRVTAEIALEDWTFATSFRYMKGYPFDQIPFTGPEFVFASEKVDSFTATAGTIALTHGLNFAAILKIEGLVAQISRLFTGTPDTAVFSGPIGFVPSTIMPALRIRADLGEHTATIGPLSVCSPFIELRVEYTPQQRKRSVVFVLGMEVAIGDDIAFDFTAPLLKDPIELSLGFAVEQSQPMTPAALFQLVRDRDWGNGVPGPLRSALQAVTLKDLAVRLPASGAATVRELAVTVGSTQGLELFDSLKLEEFDVVWGNELSFSAWLSFHPEVFPGDFEVDISSDLRIQGSYAGEVSFARLLQVITDGTIALPSGVDLTLTAFMVDLDVPKKSYSLYLEASALFDPLGTGLLVLDDVQIQLASTATTTDRAYTASLDAMLAMGGFPLAVTANHATGNGWEFQAAMPPEAEVSVEQLLERLFPSATAPDFLKHVVICNMRLAAHIGGTKPASIDTAATLRLEELKLGSLGPFTLDADVTLKHLGGDSPTTSGGVSFATTIPSIGARITLGYAFGSTAKVVSVTWGAFTAGYDITKSTLKFSVGEATLGKLLGQIVGLVIGDDGYRLPAPWSVLNELSLKDFAIEMDLAATPRTVTVDYTLPAPLDLGFLTIKGLTLGKEEGKVTVNLDATFVGGAKVPEFDPLDKPPDVPGGTPFDLRLLALGQRVTVPGIEKSARIHDAVKLLASFTNTPDSGLPSGAVFDASSPWLVGLHVLVLDGTVELEVVFVDPQLYGLRIALSGEKAAVFKGLDFEILYRKISDTVGVYQIRLTLPDAMRNLQFGALSIRLPLVGVDIYTNGDFRVDFGFPYNNDFSRSFGVEFFPFTGAGGVYFAELSAATAGTGIPVPAVPGTFDPVIEFGLGLQVGVGKDISAGLLKAGISLTVFGIVEGVIAQWNPAEDSGSAELVPLLAELVAAGDLGTTHYYRVSGTIGIIGKIYGSVDFAIVKARVDLTVVASMQAVVEAHQPVPVAFVAQVDVALTVEVNLGLFTISVHLSFSMTVRESFTLGSRTKPPWELPSEQVAALAAAEPTAYVTALDFAPFAEPAEDKRPVINLAFAMHPTVAGNPSNARDTTGRLVAMLYLDTPHPNAKLPPSPELGVLLPAAESSFERFAETVFLWAVASFGAGAEQTKPTLREFTESTVSHARITAAYDHLSSASAKRPIDYAKDIVDGLFSQLRFQVNAADKSVDSAAPFPMIPQLRLVAGSVNRLFSHSTPVDDTYLDALRDYFETIAARYQNELGEQYAGITPPPTPARDEKKTSYCAAIVEDVVLMLARGMLRAALDAMDAYAHPYKGATLTAVAEALNKLGNTVDIGALGAANHSLPLTQNPSLTLTNVRYQFTAADTFDAVITRFGIIDPAAVVSHPTNATAAGILRVGVTLTHENLRHTVAEGDTLGSIAALPAWSATALAVALRSAGNAILPLAVLVLPGVTITTGTADTLSSIANAFGTTPAAVALDLKDVENLFADPEGTLCLTVPSLAALTPELLLGRLRTQGTAGHLAGAQARFLLHGMRPPAPKPGGGLGDPTALYDLTTQQIDLPTAEKAMLGIDRPQDWITFGDGSTSSVEFGLNGVIQVARNLLGVATVSGVPATVTSIAPLGTYHDKPRRFSLRRTALVQTAQPPDYPFGGKISAPAATPRLWFVPDSMAHALAQTTMVRVAYTLEVISTGNPPEVSTPQHYGWASVVDIDIKRRADFPTTYEVYGSDEAGTAALQALITPGAQAGIASIALLTGANATGQVPRGYVDPSLADVVAYLVKSDLSTDTNPRGAVLFAAAVAEEPSKKGLLNDPLDFLRLLWEASVTRNGGFHLTYRHADGTGLPDTLFAGGDRATLTVLVLHKAVGNHVHPGVNAVFVGDGLDPAHHDLSAVSSGTPVTHPTTGTESLTGIRSRYHVLLTTLGEAAAELPLTANAQIKVTGITHQVRGLNKDNPNTETLDQIAAKYGVTTNAIVNLNPGVNFNPLAALTLLRIPDVTVSGSQYATLARITDAFGVTAAHLAVTNADVPALFASGGRLAFTDQLLDRVPATQPGNVGFDLTRTNLGGGTDPKALLAAQYNLLGFGLTANVGFKATADTLPVGPTKTTPGDGTRAKLHAMADQPWNYQQVIGVAGSAVGGTLGDQYAGVSAWAQVRFTPRDIFGNIAASVMTQPTLGPAQPQNNAPLRVAYTDRIVGLGSWPSVASEHHFVQSNGSSVLRVALTFDPSPYQPTSTRSTSSEPTDVPAWQRRALADCSTYRTLHQQLSAPGMSMTVTTTMDDGKPHAVSVSDYATFAKAAADYLHALASGQTPPLIPQPPAMEVPVRAANPRDLFALDVTVTISRPAEHVDDAFRGGPAEVAATAVHPHLAVEKDATRALRGYAADLEKAFAAPPVFLKVATGRSQQSVAGEPTVWIARLRTEPGAGTDPGIGFRIKGAARYWAVRPLANVLVSRSDVPIVAYDPANGIDWDHPRQTVFTGIDLDTWGRQALAAVDRFLSPDFAGAAFLVDHANPLRYLDRLLALKADLAAAIGGTVEPVLESPDDPAARADAQESMRQQILSRAENAYIVSAICQYAATVSSSYTDNPEKNVFAPRFYGPVTAVDKTAGTKTAEDKATNEKTTGRLRSWSFTVARPKLARGTAFVTSAMTVVDPAAQSHLEMDLAFTLTNIEHDITRGVDGEYLASSWLSLVIPFSQQAPTDPTLDLSLGEVDIPVVLRRVPTAPTLVGQQTIPAPIEGDDEATRLERAKRWYYGFRYQKDVVAQDTIDCTAEFNLSDDSGLRLFDARELDLFDHLARFTAVWPAMLDSMIESLVPGKLVLDPKDQSFQRAQRLIDDFLKLLEPLPEAWKSWHEMTRHANEDTADGFPYLAFSVQEQRRSQNIDELIAVRTVNSSSTATVWDPKASRYVPLPPPDLSVIDGTTVWRAKPIPDTTDTFHFVDDTGRILTYTHGVTLGLREPDFRGLEGMGLDVAAYQNAWSAVRVFRNRDLVHDGKATNPDFVYATPQVRFASRVTPRLQRGQQFRIAKLSDPPKQPLAMHLERVVNLFFKGVEPETTQRVRLDADYDQHLSKNLPPLPAPILLGTPTQLTASKVSTFVAAISQYIKKWFDTHKPPDGTLRFTLTMFPTLTTSRLPLFQADQLLLKRENVTDLK